MKLLKLLLVALLAFFVACGEPSAEDVAVETIKAMSNGDVEKLAKNFGIDEIAKSEAEKTAYKGKFAMLASETQSKSEKKGGLKDVKVIDSTDDGEYKRVKLSLTFGNGDKEEEKVILKKLNGKWIVHK